MSRKILTGAPLIAFMILFAFLNQKVLRQPPYFDEMWKIDFIAASDTIGRFFLHNGPIPIGWLYLNKIPLWLIGDNFAATRILTAVWVPLGASLIAWQFSTTTRANVPVISIGAALIVMLTPIQVTARNFNQYPFEFFYSAALFCIALQPFPRPASSIRTALVCAFIAATPVFSLSSLFLLPSLFLIMFYKSEHASTRIALVGLALIAALVAAVMYLKFYRPVIDADLSDYWQKYIVRGDFWQLLARLRSLPSEIADSILPIAIFPFRSNIAVSIGTAAITLLCAAGLWQLWRFCRFAAVMIMGTILVVLCASLLTSWPLTFNSESRINLGWLWMLYLLFGIGLADLLSRLFPVKYKKPGLIVAISLLAAAPVMQRYDADGTPFRGMYRDIARIPTDVSDKQLVVQLHSMGHFYSHYELVRRNPRYFEMLHEQSRVDHLIPQLPALLAARPDVRNIWIIVPLESGPDRLSEAENLTLTGFVKVISFRGTGSTILQFEAVR